MKVKKNFAGSQNYTYSPQVAFMYIFNYILIACITVTPKLFATTGWLLGMIGIALVGLIGYCAGTFVIETIAVCNALLKFRSVDQKEEDSENDAAVLNFRRDEYESQEMHCLDYHPLLNHSEDTIHQSLYDIDVKYEMTEMARLLFNKFGLAFVTLSALASMYGGLMVDAATITKSVTVMVCGDNEAFQKDMFLPCKNLTHISTICMYRISIVVFTILIGPFVFFDITRSKYVQQLATFLVWLSFGITVVLAINKIAKNDGNSQPKVFEYQYFPRYLSALIYGTTCQFAIPTVMFPVSKKERFHFIILLDYISVFILYCLSGLTATFAFPISGIQDVYGLSFSTVLFVKYLLQFIPILTFGGTFITMSVNLRENMKSLLGTKESKCHVFLRRIVLPLMIIIPPIIGSYFIHNLEFLSTIFGAYTTTINSYILPSILLYVARNHTDKRLDKYKNKYRSPFGHPFWIYFVIILVSTNTVLCTYTLIKNIR